jgi:hypothetical protein
MVDEGLLIDVNKRIIAMENLIQGMVQIYGPDLGKTKSQIMIEHAEELENLREDLDDAVQKGDTDRIERDIEFLAEVDEQVEEAVETIEHGEGKRIHQELETLLEQVEREQERKE